MILVVPKKKREIYRGNGGLLMSKTDFDLIVSRAGNVYQEEDRKTVSSFVRVYA